MKQNIAAIKVATSKALADAKTPEQQSEVLETMLTSVSLMVSTMGRGNAAMTNQLLEGATAYLFERATGFQKFGAFMASAGRMPK